MDGGDRQIPDIYIWNALIELAGICDFYPLDKISLEREQKASPVSRWRRQQAMEAGLSDHVWSLEELVSLLKHESQAAA